MTMLKNFSILLLLSTSISLCGAFSNCLAETNSDYEQAKQKIFSLFDNGNYEGAKTATDQLIATFPENQDCPETIYWITRRCEWDNKYDEAKRLYQILLEKYPLNSFAGKSQLGIARTDIMSLVMSQNYNSAKTNLNKMASDFQKHPDLPESLYLIAERYEWQRQFEE